MPFMPRYPTALPPTVVCDDWSCFTFASPASQKPLLLLQTLFAFQVFLVIFPRQEGTQSQRLRAFFHPEQSNTQRIPPNHRDIVQASGSTVHRRPAEDLPLPGGYRQLRRFFRRSGDDDSFFTPGLDPIF